MNKTVWFYLKSVARKVVLRFWHSKKSYLRLDEALGDIRRLEERNADLQFQLDRSQRDLAASQQGETEIKIYNNKLTAAEIRLDEVQRALDDTQNDLDQARNESNNWRLRADERQQTISGTTYFYFENFFQFFFEFNKIRIEKRF